MKILLYVVIMIAFSIGLLVPAAILNGWALSTIWGWFVVPTFGVPALSIPTAIGISIVLSLLTHQPDLRKENGDFSKAFTYLFLRPFLVVGIAWIVKLFV